MYKRQAVYKNIELDLRQYKKIKMYVHAESLINEPKLPGDGGEDNFDERLVAFLRLGSDINENYYQIEVPLKPTSFNSNNNSRFSSESVWNPENNSIEFDLDKFLQIKLEVISKKIQSNEAIYFDEDMNLIDEFSQISQLPGQKKYKFSNIFFKVLWALRLSGIIEIFFPISVKIFLSTPVLNSLDRK